MSVLSSQPASKTKLFSSIVVNLWIHDSQGTPNSKPEVIINPELFHGNASPGDLIQLTPWKSNSASHEALATLKAEAENSRSGFGSDNDGQKKNGKENTDNNGTENQHAHYLFILPEWNPEERARPSGLQLSVAQHVATKFKLLPRTNVKLTVVDKVWHEASHVEISFRDQYLARSDMWRLAAGQLAGKCLYASRRINFLNSIKAQVHGIWIRGQKVQSAYFSSKTRPIFRSSSARFVLFVQMSKEMWHFENEGKGEILFNKMVNGFLPELFKRWKRLNARHLVSIVLFTRIVYDGDVKVGAMEAGDEHTAMTAFRKPLQYRDFFRVVVTHRESEDWTIILHQLKKEFAVFLRDILVQPTGAPLGTHIEQPVSPGGMAPTPEDPFPESFVIRGEPSTSIQGNILEAINLACNQFSRDHVDRDLVRTGISIIIITPGTGHFEVDYKMLQMTTENLVSNGIGIDLVCLSRPPLHSTPLFRYKNPNLQKTPDPRSPVISRSRAGTLHDFGKRSGSETPYDPSGHGGRRMSNATIAGKLADALNSGITDDHMMADALADEYLYAVPHWIDVSFWSNSSERKSRHHRIQAVVKSRASNLTNTTGHAKVKNGSNFKPRCKMYELQMMGVMENEVANISIPFLHENPFFVPYEDHTKHDENRLIEGPSERKELPADEKKRIDAAKKHEKAMQEYMEKYDDYAFRPLHDIQKAQDEARYRRVYEDQQRIDEIVQEDPNILSTSFRSNLSRRSLGPSTGAFFDRQMKQRIVPNSESPNETIKLGTSVEEKEPVEPKPQHRALPIPPVAKEDPKPEKSKLARGLLGSTGFKVFGSSSKATHSAATTATTQFPILTRGFTPAAVTARTSINSTSTGFLSNAIFSPDLYIRNHSTASISQASIYEGKDSDSKSLNEFSLNTPKPSRPIAIRNTASEMKEEPKPPSAMALSPTERRQGIALREGRLSKGGQIDTLKAASQARLAAPRLDLTQTSAQLSTAPTASPASSILPWLTILNPSNPKKVQINAKNQFRRWQHVFPRPLRVSTMKWKSLCSPAALPLTTEYFPTLEQLANEYSESPYVISQNDDDDVEEISKNRKELVREMVSQRLSRGFQIVVGAAVQEATINRISEPDIFAMNYLGKAGSSVYMSMGPHIHQLICDEEYNVEVKRYTRMPPGQKNDQKNNQRNSQRNNQKNVVVVPEPIKYSASVRTNYSDTYQPLNVEFKLPQSDYSWNYVDRYIAGYEEDFVEPMRFWRARFVLIPVDLPSGAGLQRRQTVTGIPQEDLNDEEIRLEGIQKLTQLFQRHRYLSPEERRYEKKKVDNPLEIVFKTANPSVVVAREVESLPLIGESDTTARRQHLITGSDMFERSSMRLPILAQELQGPRGIRLQDRRWHLRLHYNCFIGSEFVTWVLQNFKDVDTREEAIGYGNDLMQEGLFQHVERRHAFRDGNFFYQLQSEYVAARPMSRGGWFGGRTKPFNLGDDMLPGSLSRARSNSVIGDAIYYNQTDSSSSIQTPKQKARVALSKVMRYNLDPNGLSYRPEIIKLHYDRVHNPENCYHIRIEWLNVTAKLIDDALTTWTKTVHRYGLKLVEAPVDEISTITESDPFRSPIIAHLCIPPPNSLENSISLSTFYQEAFFYHEAILKKFNFVLDLEAAKNFPADVEVSYSWGRPTYRYTQYIHRTGVVFAQITEAGDFRLLANRLFQTRGGTDANKFDTNNSGRDDRRGENRSAKGGGGGLFMSTFPHAPASSSFAAGSGFNPMTASQQTFITAEMIKEELMSFCKDPEKLRAFYDEIDSKSVTTIPPTPHVGPLGGAASAPLGPTIVGIANIPSIPGGGLGTMSPSMRDPVSPAMLALGSISNASTSSISTLTGNRSNISVFSGDKRSASQSSGLLGDRDRDS
ncbi:vacuolar membrane-associated protein iml1 [Orbilia blumenaviensis]|uniref:Vacuolar membrane-associated protein IML1 n=1 Tax=Orbilia blumenaviensis TaxID=1796055 RepID=A0AAV9UVW9_9PEZI